MSVAPPKINRPAFKKGSFAAWTGNMVVLFLLACLSLGFVGGWIGAKSSSQNVATSNAGIQKQYISNESQLIESIARNVGQSVVSIDVQSQAQAQDIFGFTQTQNQQSAGTGFILNKDGIIITNRHVVPAGTTAVSVTLSDGTKLDNVEVIGRTNASDSLDVAFLRIKDAKGKTLVPVKLGDSSKVLVGEKVVAIGNALGQFQNTVTSGIISGHGRDITAGDSGSSSGADSENLTNLFQTDASINPGNSGGPLVNMNGEVIGINTAVASGSVQNIGFAIPINDIKGLITSVLQKGKLEKPYLGVRYVSLTDDYAYQFNLSVKRGAYIAPPQDAQPSIIPGSPADKAGLKEKDVIVKVNDTPINETTSLSSALGKFQVGDTATLTVNRGGKEQQIKVTLEAAPTQ
jgi:serine protease Do